VLSLSVIVEVAVMVGDTAAEAPRTRNAMKNSSKTENRIPDAVKHLLKLLFNAAIVMINRYRPDDLFFL
jgi:hypothetical protein